MTVDIAELYQVPLDRFVAARTALLRRLRDAGDREAADAVARLRKPSLGAWVVNRLAVEAPDLVADLLASASDAMDAQRSLADDGGQALRDATSRFRSLLDEVGRRSRAILDGAGHPVADATIRRAQTTAQAAASGGRGEREALLRGTLDRDLDPPGFGPPEQLEADADDVAHSIAGRRATSPRPAGPAPPARTNRDRRVTELEHAVQREERRARDLRRNADQASSTAVSLRERADRLSAEARTAADEAEAGARLAAAAEASAGDAETRLEQAHRALRAAQG